MKSMKKQFVLAAVLLLGAIGLGPAHARADTPQRTVDQAATAIQRFKAMEEQGIPRDVLAHCKGLAILTVMKAGFVFSGRGGSGVVVARTPKGWSGPSLVGTGGAGFGPQIGAEVTEFVFVLNTDEAVAAFARGGNLVLGTDLSVAAGPFGRSAEAGVTPLAAVYSYSRSEGFFAGASLEGTVIATRDDANARYYGRPVDPMAILAGRVAPPRGARRLRLALARD